MKQTWTPLQCTSSAFFTLFLSIVALLVLGACAAKPAPRVALPIDQQQNVERHLTRQLDANQTFIHALKGYARVKMKVHGQTQNFNAAIFLQRQDPEKLGQFRFEVLDDFANLRFLLTCDGSFLRVVDFERDENLWIDLTPDPASASGEPNRSHQNKNAQRALHLLPRLFWQKQTLGLLMGQWPMNAEPALMVSKNELGQTEVIFQEAEFVLGPEEQIQTIQIRSKKEHYQYNASELKPIATMSTLKTMKGTPIRLPFLIQWKDFKNKTELKLQYETLESVEQLPANLFEAGH